MTRLDVLAHYRHLRLIGTDHQDGALEFVAPAALLEQARRLRLAFGQTMVGEEAEMTLVFDLALYASRAGRSRAIDRYARAARPPAGSDEARVLEAMRRATFSMWKINRLHDTAGLVVTDMLRNSEAWLIDEGLEASGRDDEVFASRLVMIDGFAMTCGVIVPITRDIVGDVLMDAQAWGHADLSGLAQDSRFACSIYRAAIDRGVMDRVAYA